MAITRWIKILVTLGVLGLAAIMVYGFARNHPEDLPWTELDLSRPIGAFTGRKLTSLSGGFEKCRALLGRAGVSFATPAPRRDGPDCGYDDAVRLRPEAALTIDFLPRSPVISCPVAASVALWEWHVVQPAAVEHFGQRVAAIEHFGSYSCRRTYGRREGRWSEHATANALDIASFRLEDGRRISVAGDWQGDDGDAAFLRDVRNGACRLFATVLSPDYNRAHADHLHLDHAARGEMGWRVCR